MKNNTILAIDFDDTIAEVDFPHILGVKAMAAQVIHQLYREGYYIIINTCRSGEHEKQAIDFLRANNIPFDLVNTNHPELIRHFVYDCRKIAADIYIDDKNVDQIGRRIDWPLIYEKIHRADRSVDTLLDKLSGPYGKPSRTKRSGFLY